MPKLTTHMTTYILVKIIQKIKFNKPSEIKRKIRVMLTKIKDKTEDKLSIDRVLAF